MQGIDLKASFVQHFDINHFISFLPRGRRALLRQYRLALEICQTLKATATSATTMLLGQTEAVGTGDRRSFHRGN